VQLIERRKFKRYHSRVPLSMRVLDAFGRIKAFSMQTKDVSREGPGIELYEVQQDILSLIPFIVLKKKAIELDIKLPPTGEMIRGTGKITWYDTGSTETPYPHLRLGIFLEQMKPEDRKKWEDFVGNVAREEDGKSPKTESP